VRDRYGRAATDLRISLTQRCNLKCVFCHMEGQPASHAELTPSEIETIVRAGTRIGIERVKLTGGEPTLRGDIVEIVERLSPMLGEVSMTTNGLLLESLAKPLRDAGLARVNVSLPSLDPATYRELTGVDGVERVIRGIRAARAAGLHPVKLNVVALSGATDSEASVDRLISFAQDTGAQVQLIEFENVRGRVDPNLYRQLHSDLGRLTEEAARRAFRTEHNRLHDRPRYTWERGGRPITLEIVQPVENPAFCMRCQRLRLTSDGFLKGCLMTNQGLVNVGALLRAQAPFDDLVRAFETAVDRRRPFFTGPETPAPSAPETPSDPYPALELPVLARP
jgi:GTP 3',8-cyclase